MKRKEKQVPAIVLMIQLPVPQALLEDPDMTPEAIGHMCAPVIGQTIEDQVNLYRLQHGIR